jgi:hypothetical protein
MKPEIAGAFYLTSQLGGEYLTHLEQLFFFNDNQWKMTEALRRAVEVYGTPQIRKKGECLSLEFESLPQAQTLFLMRTQTPPELAGVVSYAREGTILKVLYVGLKPCYTYPQYSDNCLLALMVGSLKDIGKQIAGVTGIDLMVGNRALRFQV